MFQVALALCLWCVVAHAASPEEAPNILSAAIEGERARARGVIDAVVGDPYQLEPATLNALANAKAPLKLPDTALIDLGVAALANATDGVNWHMLKDQAKDLVDLGLPIGLVGAAATNQIKFGKSGSLLSPDAGKGASLGWSAGVGHVGFALDPKARGEIRAGYVFDPKTRLNWRLSVSEFGRSLKPKYESAVNLKAPIGRYNSFSAGASVAGVTTCAPSANVFVSIDNLEHDATAALSFVRDQPSGATRATFSLGGSLESRKKNVGRQLAIDRAGLLEWLAETHKLQNLYFSEPTPLREQQLGYARAVLARRYKELKATQTTYNRFAGGSREALDAEVDVQVRRQIEEGQFGVGTSLAN